MKQFKILWEQSLINFRFLFLRENVFESNVVMPFTLTLRFGLFRNFSFLVLLALFSGLAWAGVFPKLVSENTWPPHLIDNIDLWGIYQIAQPRPLSPVAYCAGLEANSGREEWVFRVEGEAIFDGDVTATGPMCHEFDRYGASLGGTGLRIVAPANFNPFRNLGGGCSPLINNGSNPINAATGNKYQHEIDYSPQIGPTLSRHYNSFASGFAFDSTGNKKVWLTNYDKYLRIQTYTESNSFGKIYIYTPSGNIFIFEPDGNGNFIPEDVDNLDKLVPLAGGGWRLIVDDDNSVENYDESGKLLSRSDRSGRTQTLTYDLPFASGGDDDPQTLDTVTDDTGRHLLFSYDILKRIISVTDLSGNIITYSYDNQSNLVSVTYPDGRSKIYHYNEPAYTSDTDLPHALTGITDENGIRFATFTYDNTGRAIISEHADGSMRHTFNYNTDRSTDVIDPLGAPRTYQFQFIHGAAKSVSQSQPAGAGCNAASSATTYDVNGNVDSRTDFNGNKTCFAFDMNRNLEIARVEGLAAGNVCPSDLVNYTPANVTERKTLTN